MAAETTPCGACNGEGTIVECDRHDDACAVRLCGRCAGSGETTPSVTDAEVEAMAGDPTALDLWSFAAFDREASVIFSITKGGDFAGDLEAAIEHLESYEVNNICLPFLRALLAARREADARVAAAVMAEREAAAGKCDALARFAKDLPDPHPSRAWAAAAQGLALQIRSRPAPDHAPTLATLLAEAREQGRREMREMAAVAVNVTLSPHGMGGMTPEEVEEAGIRQHCAGIIRALPVTIPTPEAPQ